MARSTLITCDGCGETLPGADSARYVCQLTCMAGPNLTHPVFGERTADLCGFCASLVANIIAAKAAGYSRPVAIELEGAVT